MEMEFFCEPGTDDEWHRYWIDYSFNWFAGLGLRSDKLRVREHGADELPHYSKASADIEFLFPWGWGELETISNRTDYDLGAHIAKSGRDLSYNDQPNNRRYVPYVVEPAMGADRSALAFIVDAYDEETVNDTQRVVLRFHPKIAPYQVAVLPLSRNDKLTPTARRVYDLVRSEFSTQYDETQSIGRRYRRAGRNRYTVVRYRGLRDRGIRLGGNGSQSRHDGTDPDADQRLSNRPAWST